MSAKQIPTILKTSKHTLSVVKMPTEARNAEQELMEVEGEGGGGTNGFHDHQLPDSPVSHDDGYFTSAVSVQHKVSKFVF